MRRQFRHLLPLTEAEVETIWIDGTVTVDAHALHDLYRYHSETRDALMHALRNLMCYLWPFIQAASEFVCNRARAASAIGKDLADADGDMKDRESALKKTTDDLRGRRSLPRDVSQRPKTDVDAAIRWHQVLPQANDRECPKTAASCSTTSSSMAPAGLAPITSRRATSSRSWQRAFER